LILNKEQFLLYIFIFCCKYLLQADYKMSEMSDYQSEYNNQRFDKIKYKFIEVELSIIVNLVKSKPLPDLPYNTSENPVILFTKYIMNDLLQLTSIEEVNKYLLNNCDVLQLKDNCYIIYNPIINNDTLKVKTTTFYNAFYKELSSYYIVWGSLRINNFQEFIIHHPNVIINNYIYEFIMLKIKYKIYHTESDIYHIDLNKIYLGYNKIKN